jgi:hypothetical protein
MAGVTLNDRVPAFLLNGDCGTIFAISQLSRRNRSGLRGGLRRTRGWNPHVRAVSVIGIRFGTIVKAAASLEAAGLVPVLS